MDESIDFETGLLEQVAQADRKTFRRTLDELCDGCDRGFIVVRLAMRKAPQFAQTSRWEIKGRWELRKAESAETKTGYYAGTRDFEAVRKRAARLLLDVRRLRTTLWIQQLQDTGKIRTGDLLHPLTGFDGFDG